MAGGRWLPQVSLFPEPLEPGTRWPHVDLLRLRAALASDTIADGRGSYRARAKSCTKLYYALDDGQGRLAIVLDLYSKFGFTHGSGRNGGLDLELLWPWTSLDPDLTLFQPQDLCGTLCFFPAIQQFESGILIERDFDALFDFDQGLRGGFCLQYVPLVQLKSPLPLQAVL